MSTHHKVRSYKNGKPNKAPIIVPIPKGFIESPRSSSFSCHVIDHLLDLAAVQWTPNPQNNHHPNEFTFSKEDSSDKKSKLFPCRWLDKKIGKSF
jgi:hypothetical protein